MVTVGFVVEGASEKRLVESKLFRKWLQEDCNLEVVDPVVDAAGNGNMCSRNIETFVKNLRTSAKPNKVVVLAELDPDTCAPCVQKRKEIIGCQGIDLVAIAKKSIDDIVWFGIIVYLWNRALSGLKFHDNVLRQLREDRRLKSHRFSISNIPPIQFWFRWFFFYLSFCRYGLRI